jgi:hypothetical protein
MKRGFTSNLFRTSPWGSSVPPPSQPRIVKPPYPGYEHLDHDPDTLAILLGENEPAITPADISGWDFTTTLTGLLWRARSSGDGTAAAPTAAAYYAAAGVAAAAPPVPIHVSPFVPGLGGLPFGSDVASVSGVPGVPGASNVNGVAAVPTLVDRIATPQFHPAASQWQPALGNFLPATNVGIVSLVPTLQAEPRSVREVVRRWKHKANAFYKAKKRRLCDLKPRKAAQWNQFY